MKLRIIDREPNTEIKIIDENAKHIQSIVKQSALRKRTDEEWEEK